MSHPEGYRKALRLMKQAEKFKRPIICLIDTPGAYCGIGAEERGQGEAIARNLLEMSLDDESVVLAVEDQGSGIAPEVLDKLGTPFFTTKDQGTGLGLVTCYSIASHHGATVEIATGATGTTFRVRFPARG
jgi:signal transduction histidine kinase